MTDRNERKAATEVHCGALFTIAQPNNTCTLIMCNRPPHRGLHQYTLTETQDEYVKRRAAEYRRRPKLPPDNTTADEVLF